MKRVLYISLLSIFVVVFLVSGYFLVDYLMESHKQQSEFNNLAQIVDEARKDHTTPTAGANDPTSPNPAEPENPDQLVTVTDPDTGEEVQVLAEYAPLYELNNDLVGWIRFDDTIINYPVMQSVTKDYYLYVSFADKYSNHGCIYAREGCDVFKPSDNVTIYGHRMQDGTMFASLHNYLDKAYWESHQTFTFDTIREHHTYQIIAVFKTTANEGGFPYWRFDDATSQAEFDQFVSDCKQMSFYDTGLTAEYGDKLVCLSTCEYTLSNGRLIVLAKRIA